MSQVNWKDWHAPYDDPESPMSRRLAAVQRRIRDALDSHPAGQLRAISVCAGQGHDLLGVLREHPRCSEVVARLVELDAGNVLSAREAARAAGLARVEVVQGDAALTDAYEGLVPADLVLVCGLFGNISDADVARVISNLPTLCASNATVVWTRHLAPPDLTASIRGWFTEAGFAELHFEMVADRWGVGSARFVGSPALFKRDVRLFDFLGYDQLV